MKLDCHICCASELENLKTEDLTLTDILYCDNCGLVQIEMKKLREDKHA